ncbi:MAG: DMT family transporter [Gammaproteobacteria bacterium]|nr:DMT family transporter [Gammaproteobacteria bacterium]
MIQALAKSKQAQDESAKGYNPKKNCPGILAFFDYLSTVSGGGYIGSWLSAWLHREKIHNGVSNLAELQDKLTTRPCGFSSSPTDDSECAEDSGFRKPRSSGFPPLEHSAVRHLRRFSNYLSPRLGISGDLLAVISLFLRNFVILQLVLILLVAGILLLPYVATSITAFAIGSPPLTGDPATGLFWLGTLLLAGTLIIWRLQFRDITMPADDDDKLEEWRAQHRQRQKTSGLWMTASVILLPFAFWLIMISLIPWLIEIFRLAEDIPKYFILLYAMFYFVAWLFSPGFFPTMSGGPGVSLLNESKRILIALVAAVLFGGFIHLVTVLADVTTFGDPERKAFITVIGAPVILLITSFTIAFQLGLARNLYSERERERWARAGGLVLMSAGVWLAVFATSVYAPPFINWLGNGGFAAMAAWAGTSTVGAWLARSSSTMAGKSGISWNAIIARIAPWFFLIGLALIVSFGLSILVNAINLRSPLGTFGFPSDIPISAGIVVYSMLMEYVTVANAMLIFLVIAALFLLFSWRLDLNMFSAHAIYKNRLVRAYLGASNLERRNPNPFTGFDPKDDFEFSDMAGQTPIHIINATINMSGGDDLAWQTRRAASFSFTPSFMGFEAKSSKGVDLGGFRSTAEFSRRYDNFVTSRDADKASNSKKFTLGTAFAISGAAASPNMGYNTSAPIAALLTVFNMRLAYWAGNPSKDDDKPKGWFSKLTGLQLLPSWRRKSPLISAQPLVAELTGSANAESNWVNLSDGGHFDNLGIYELVRRRCRLIVVTDAGCDKKHEFQDLANTVRKCWTDFGVHIYFPDLKNLCLEEDGELICSQHGSLGLIEYPDRGRPEETGKKSDYNRYGLILYLKCSLTREVMDKYIDIRQYANTHDSFPHEPTSDQFFDENQFEAYRHLGYYIAMKYRPVIEKLMNLETQTLNRKKVAKAAQKIVELHNQGRNDPTLTIRI